MDGFITDLNGTLVNDARLVWRSINEVFIKAKKTPLTFEECMQEVASSPSLWQWLKKRGIPFSRDEIHKIYNDFYRERLEVVPIFPDVIEAFERLREREVPIFLVTGQRKSLAMPLVLRYNLLPYFAEMHFRIRNKTRMLFKIIRGHRLDPAFTYYCGDLPTDISSTNRVQIRGRKMQSVAVFRGHIPEKLLREAKPDYLISDLKKGAELP